MFSALITFCVPCLTFGQVAEIVDNGHTCKSLVLANTNVILETLLFSFVTLWLFGKWYYHVTKIQHVQYNIMQVFVFDLWKVLIKEKKRKDACLLVLIIF